MFKGNRQNVWDKMFSPISEKEIALAKQMTYNCLDFCDNLLNSDVITTLTLGQHAETLAFVKTFHFYLITKSQVVYNLFYSYFYEYYVTYCKMSMVDVIFEENSVKFAEKWYLDEYFNAEGPPINGMMGRYYRSMKRLQNDELKTHVSLSYEDFRQIIGPMLENLHHKYLV